eukprot:341521_1
MSQTSDTKYNEIIKLNPIEMELNLSEIADFIIDLEYDTSINSVDPSVTLRNINFIISCYIWYYIRDNDNWEIIKPLTNKEKNISNEHLLLSHYNYKSKYYFESQPGIINTFNRVPKSFFIGSAIGIASTIGAATFCINGVKKLLSANIENAKNILFQHSNNNINEKLIQLPTIPLGICASIIVSGIVGVTTLIIVPIASLSSAGLYLANGTDLTDKDTWQYIGSTKLNFE